MRSGNKHSWLSGTCRVVTVVAAILFAAGPASSQPEPPLGKFPAGFEVTSQSVSPTRISIEGKKPHNIKSCINVDPDIHIGYSWSAMSAAASEMIAKSMGSREEAPSRVMGVETKTVSRERVKNGTLVVKKLTMPQVGTSCEEWITYSGTWSGVAGDGLLVISVSNGAGAKESIKGWIVSLLP